MIRTRTFRAGILVVLFFPLSVYSQVARAQEVPCDNSQAESVIPANKKGQPLMPKEIQDDSEIMEKLKYARLNKEDIKRCLENDDPLKNHVIDFDLYAKAWEEIKDSKPALRIQDSVLWSFKEGLVGMAAFAEKLPDADGKTTLTIHVPIQWKNVTVGPSFSVWKKNAHNIEKRKTIESLPGTSFESSRFPIGADFSKATFGADASFSEATFGADASFFRTTFYKRASFSEAKFGDRASFSEAKFGEHASFSEATFGADASFSGATFGADASFSGATFVGHAFFSGAKFVGHAFFEGTTFGDHASFFRTTFYKGASFSEATFGADASFFRTTFYKRAFFSEATFGDRASFGGGTIFGEHASFSEATFGEHAFFSGAKFVGHAFFEGTTFGDRARFEEAIFDANASFRGTTFGGAISLQRATVKGELNLAKTNWEGRADFRESGIQDLCWNSEDRPSGVKGIFDARKAKFKKAVIKDVHFSDLVDFSDAEFGRVGNNSSNDDTSKTDSCGRKAEKIIFENAIFEKEVDFLRAEFWNDAIFVRNRFRGVWELTGATFERKEGQDKKGEQEEEEKNSHLCLSFNRIGKLFMERNHLGYESSWTKDFFPLTALKKSRIRGVVGDEEYSCAPPGKSHEKNESSKESESGAPSGKSHEKNESGKESESGAPSGKSREKNENEDLWEIYRTIESSFREVNDRLAENEAWYLGIVAEQESQDADMQKWAFLILGDFPSRYGIDLYRVVLVSVVLMLFFAIFYTYYFKRQIRINKRKQYVKLKPFPDQKRAFRFRPFERFSQSWEKQKRPLHPLKDALFLSGRAFFKLGLGTAYPRTRMLVWIVHVEWILGMFMLIHFLVAVKNTLPIAVPFLAVAG